MKTIWKSKRVKIHSKSVSRSHVEPRRRIASFLTIPEWSLANSVPRMQITHDHRWALSIAWEAPSSPTLYTLPLISDAHFLSTRTAWKPEFLAPVMSNTWMPYDEYMPWMSRWQVTSSTISYLHMQRVKISQDARMRPYHNKAVELRQENAWILTTTWFHFLLLHEQALFSAF